VSAPLLFLGHAADRTGPPIYLLHLLRWLEVNHPDVPYEVALLAGGELLPEFQRLAPTSVYEGLPPGRWDRAERAWLLEHLDQEDRWWAMRRRRQLEHQMRQHRDARVVYVNSAPSIDLALALPPGDRVQISHVHELETGLAHRLTREQRRALLGGGEVIFVPARAVADNLIARHGVAAERIAVHPELVDLSTFDPAPADRATARTERGLPVDAPIVGTAGTLDWRKAVDLFLRVAWHVVRQPRPTVAHFVWVGGHPDAIRRAEAEVERLGLGHVVHFVGVRSDPVEWFRLFDVFVLPAREDPFPLVCLEAAAVGCPVVAFDNGGMPELLVRGAGEVVAYPDVEGFADQVGGLLDDDDRRRALGERGRTLIATEFDVSVQAPRWWADVARWLP
jgi:glycosyltransferase involved in cell wall biosynthesis